MVNSLFKHVFTTTIEYARSRLTIDVAILYEIVQTAEQQPQAESQPFRALFAAYDLVLPRYGLDTANDQVYLRFLFRLGDGRSPQESLFASFERLLEELGIRIEFDESTLQSLPSRRAPEPRRRGVSVDTAYRGLAAAYRKESQLVRPSTRATSRLSERTYRRPHHRQPSISGHILDEYKHKYLVPGVSPVELLRMADEFAFQQTALKTHLFLYAWRRSALDQKRRRKSSWLTAEQHDCQTLQRQILEHWHDKATVQRQDREQEASLLQCLQQWTLRSQQHLCHKALSHWQRCTFDRQRELWLVRRRALFAKFFHLWSFASQQSALLVEQSLKSRNLQRWRISMTFHLETDKSAVCFRQVWDRKLYLLSWIRRWQRKLAFEQTQTAKKRRILHRFYIDSTLSSRSHTMLHSKGQSVVHKWKESACRRRSMESHGKKMDPHVAVRFLKLLRYHLQLRQCLRTVSNMADWRIAATMFVTLTQRAQMHSVASTFEKVRLSHTWWIQWLMHFRQRAMARKVQDRLLVRVLYQWIIQSRAKCMQRLDERRLAGQALVFWAHKSNVLMDLQQLHLDPLILGHSLTLWARKLAILDQLYREMLVKTSENLLRAFFTAVRSAITRQEQRQALAHEAASFFLGQKALNTWLSSLLVAKQRRLRQCLQLFLHDHRLAVLRRYLKNWQSYFDRLGRLHRIIQQFAHDHDLRLVLNTAEQWHGKMSSIQDTYLEAKASYDHHCQRSFFARARRQRRFLEGLEEVSQGQYREGTQRQVLIVLRRLKVRMIELQGQKSKAERLQTSYQRNHDVEKWRLWRSRILRRAESPEAEESHNLPSSTPLSRFSTPAPSIRPRLHFSTRLPTQSSTPKGTPFQNRLRAQLNLTPGRLEP